MLMKNFSETVQQQKFVRVEKIQQYRELNKKMHKASKKCRQLYLPLEFVIREASCSAMPYCRKSEAKFNSRIFKEHF